MTVRQNVAYGGKDARRRVPRALPHLAPRRRAAGGSSRAASASASRSRARSPATPPCCCSTSRCRRSTRTRRGRCAPSCRSCSHELALPTLLVTHDFEDAAALADQVGVIVDGGSASSATPSELVARPADAFVASFTGANLLRGHARRLDDDLTLVGLETGELRLLDRGSKARSASSSTRGKCRRPPRHQDSAMNLIRGEIRSVVIVGNRVRVRIGPITAEVTASSAEKLELARGGIAFATFKATGTRLFHSPELRAPPARFVLVEKRAQPFLPLVARTPLLADPARGLRSGGALATSRFAHRAACGPADRSSPTTRSTAASRSSATSLHEPDAQCRLGVEALARDEVAAARAPAPIFASANGEITAGMIPSFTSENANAVSRAEIAMSAAATSPAPPPSA